MAHKKGTGSTRNGRDSNSKRSVKVGGEKVTRRSDFNAEGHPFCQESMLVKEKMTLFLHSKKELWVMKALKEIWRNRKSYVVI